MIEVILAVLALLVLGIGVELVYEGVGRMRAALDEFRGLFK